MLTTFGRRDIVDTVHYENGNVWKMLFGAVNRGLDDDDDDDTLPFDRNAAPLPFPCCDRCKSAPRRGGRQG